MLHNCVNIGSRAMGRAIINEEKLCIKQLKQLLTPLVQFEIDELEETMLMRFPIFLSVSLRIYLSNLHAILFRTVSWHFTMFQQPSSIKNFIWIVEWWTLAVNFFKDFFLYGNSWTTWLRLDFENKGSWTSMQLLSNYVIMFLEGYRNKQTKLR